MNHLLGRIEFDQADGEVFTFENGTL